jgi:hypothetical protein
MASSKYFQPLSLSTFKHPSATENNNVVYISNNHLHDTPVSRIYSNNLKTLLFPGYVVFEDVISGKMYNNGEKYKVIFIEEDHFIIEGQITSKYNQQLAWKNTTIPYQIDFESEIPIALEAVEEIQPVIARAIDSKKYSKKSIPKAVKSHIWEHYIGRHINEHRCLCCKKAYIRNTDFVTGHVISEANGGTLEINNLRPICAVCNNGMGKMNMVDYVKKYGYYI